MQALKDLVMFLKDGGLPIFSIVLVLLIIGLGFMIFFIIRKLLEKDSGIEQRTLEEILKLANKIDENKYVTQDIKQTVQELKTKILEIEISKNSLRLK